MTLSGTGFSLSHTGEQDDHDNRADDYRPWRFCLVSLDWWWRPSCRELSSGLGRTDVDALSPATVTLVRGKCSGRCQSALLGPMGSVAFTFDPVRSSTEEWTVVQLGRRRQWPTQLFL
jgi:hypothetical protein